MTGSRQQLEAIVSWWSKRQFDLIYASSTVLIIFMELNRIYILTHDI